MIDPAEVPAEIAKKLLKLDKIRAEVHDYICNKIEKKFDKKDHYAYFLMLAESLLANHLWCQIDQSKKPILNVLPKSMQRIETMINFMIEHPDQRDKPIIN